MKKLACDELLELALSVKIKIRSTVVGALVATRQHSKDARNKRIKLKRVVRLTDSVSVIEITKC